jgi:hypothetical protein
MEVVAVGRVLLAVHTPAVAQATPPLFPQVLAWLLWSGKKWHTHEFKKIWLWKLLSQLMVFLSNNAFILTC